MQHCWPTTPNIGGCYVLRPFAHNSPENRSQTTAACKKWMKSSITIAVSSVCNNEILTDGLNKIQLRTVRCSINFYFCGKQTMNVFFHRTFAWICVDFSCKTAFISYHVMSAKTNVLKCCCFVVWLNWVLRKFNAIKSWVMIGLWWL